MYSTTKYDVLWSPAHDDKFVLWGSDLTLYEVAPHKDLEKKPSCIKISSSWSAAALASQSASGVRCVDISYIGAPEPLLALGHSSGKVSLTSLGLSTDPVGMVGQEYVPRYGRLCNSVAWSPVENNMLATAMDKHRSEHCILLWDVNQNNGSASASTEDTPSSSGADSPRPIAEMGLSETAHNVSWCHDHNRTLLVSMNMKHIKKFDLRDLSNKAVQVTSTRYCYGVTCDPGSPWQVASRGDSTVCVWDLRMFDTPVLTVTQPRPIMKIQWCPTRRNLLCSLQRDSSTLCLHDIQQSHNKGTQPVEISSLVESSSGSMSTLGAAGVSAVERGVSPSGGAPVCGFVWHLHHQGQLLAVTPTGVVTWYVVCERSAVAGGAGGVSVAGGVGGAGVPLHLHEPPNLATALRAKANQHYGLKPDLWQNAELADDESVSNLWHFLALSKSLLEDGCIKTSPWKHPGVLTVIGGEGYRSEPVPSLLPDVPNRRVIIYRSAWRARALQLCGWGWGWENAGAGVERAEAEGHPARAAALAAFHLRLRVALQVLTRAGGEYRIAGLALAGLSEERLWREMVAGCGSAFSDPYLRGLLQFLSNTQPANTPSTHYIDMQPVLNETEMRLEDRVAFACIYLPDAKLQEYVTQLANTLVEQGNLSGILLTGTSPLGVDLIQRWVDSTGDVQTAALVAARCLTPELLQTPNVTHWLDSYRSLLDAWRLWSARCGLDTRARASGAAPPSNVSQMMVSCNYCGKAIWGGSGRVRAPFSRLPPPAAKMKQISSCPNCRKPLPRCAVCLGGVGTGAGGAHFGGWLCWCLQCRHGGHATHLVTWFKDHSECPVSSCNCRCNSLDPPDRMSTTHDI